MERPRAAGRDRDGSAGRAHPRNLRREEALAPITDGRADFDLADAYRVSARILARRIARGERPVGWKIGFTNRTIWDEYGVHVSI